MSSITTTPVKPTSASRKSTPKAPRKGIKEATKSSPSQSSSKKDDVPVAPMKTKLGACGPVKPKKVFIQHDAKTLPVQFVGNFLRTNDNGKQSIEIDDDTYKYLNSVAAKFSTDVLFKTPATSGKGNTEGRYFVAGSMGDEVTEKVLDEFLRQTVEVFGNLKTYHFVNDQGQTVMGCSLKIDEMALPKTDEDADTEEADE